MMMPHNVPEPEEFIKDEEGLNTFTNLGRNMAYLLKKLKP